MNIRIPVLLTPLALAACHGEAEHGPTAEPMPTASVKTMTVSSQDTRATESVAGTVRARLQATLAAKIPGRIKMMSVSVGDQVKSGQVVVRLEAREIEARLRQARAVLSQAEADLARFTKLFEQKAATRQELEGVRTRHAVAEASVAEAGSMLEEATVRAPFAGVATQDMADVGDLATPGRPLLSVEAPGALRLEVAVSEALVGFMKMGQTISVEIGEESYEGTVGEIAPSADPNSRTFLVKIDLPEDGGFKAGQFGRALLPTRSEEIVRVPKSAVVRRGQLELVFVVEKGEARLRLVRTGKHFGDSIEIVSGLGDDEEVVVEGAPTLGDGQPVEVVSGEVAR